MPLTELWLSAVISSREPGTKGKASATSFSAPEAFGVKIAVYSPAALKKSSTAARALSTRSVIALELGLAECGLPKTLLASMSACSRTCEAACRLPPV